MNKPLTFNCKRYCSQYPCDKKECTMRKLIKNNKIIMASAQICDYFDNRMAYNNWHGHGETMLNNDVFTRRKLGR